MANNDATKVVTGKPKIGGAVFRAPLGTELPTDTVAPLNEAFKNLGYCSEDGVVNSNSPESSETKAWGGDIVLNMQTAKKDTFAFKLIEALNEDVIKAVYNEANVTGTLTSGLTIKANNAESEQASWVFEMILKDHVKRIVIPCASIAELGDIVYKDDDTVGYEVTLAGVPDAEGQTHYEYIKKAEV